MEREREGNRDRKRRRGGETDRQTDRQTEINIQLFNSEDVPQPKPGMLGKYLRNTPPQTPRIERT